MYQSTYSHFLNRKTSKTTTEQNKNDLLPPQTFGEPHELHQHRSCPSLSLYSYNFLTPCEYKKSYHAACKSFNM